MKKPIQSVMTQTGTYDKVTQEEEDLETQREKFHMIRPALDYSAVSMSKTETLSWAQEMFEEDQKREKLPTAVLRPSTPSKPEQLMRGVNDGIHKELNSNPDEERIFKQPDDATIRSTEASTAKLRRPSQYLPTDVESAASDETLKPQKISMATGSRYVGHDAPSGSSDETYQPAQKPDYLDHLDTFDEMMDEKNIVIEKTSGTFNGVYFPCFGIFASPLYGTEIFPLPPKQEKYHLNLLMGKPTDHYDGNPNSSYEDEIRRFMNPIIFAYDKMGARVNDQSALNHRLNVMADKFPYSSSRVGESVTVFRPMMEIENMRSVEHNPGMLTSETDFATVRRGTNQTKSTVTGLHNPPKPIESKDRLINKKQQLEAEKLRLFIGEADFRQSSTMETFDKFTKVVEHFRKNGGSFQSPSSPIRRLAVLREIITVTDMQDWLVKNQGRQGNFNAYHDDWCQGPLLAKRFTQTERTRASMFMLTCLDFHNFMNIRDQVKHWKKFH